MFIYNKKNGNIQECHNADAIKVCRKDTDHYLVAATREELEGKAANKPQEEPKSRRRGKIPKNPKKPLLRALRSSQREMESSRQQEETLKAVRNSRRKPVKAAGNRKREPEKRKLAMIL